MNKSALHTPLFLALSLLPMTVSAEEAEDTDNVITVTADYRESALQNTTTSVSVMSEEDLPEGVKAKRQLLRALVVQLFKKPRAPIIKPSKNKLSLNC